MDQLEKHLEGFDNRGHNSAEYDSDDGYSYEHRKVINVYMESLELTLLMCVCSLMIQQWIYCLNSQRLVRLRV
jgi:hypothetical protein